MIDKIRQILIDNGMIEPEALNESTKEILLLFGVSNSNFIKFEEWTEVPKGVYKILTDKGRIIQAEMIFNRWMEYDTPIHDGEKVVGYYR